MSIFFQALDVLLIIMSISLLICFVRLYLGPDVPDRANAFDLITVHAMGLFGLVAMRFEASSLLDGAIITAVLAFLGTVMLARYLENSK